METPACRSFFEQTNSMLCTPLMPYYNTIYIKIVVIDCCENVDKLDLGANRRKYCS
jgi:hypothetical protein